MVYLKSLLEVRFELNENDNKLSFLEKAAAEKCIELIESIIFDYDCKEDDLDINENENPDEMDTDYCVEEFDKDTRNDCVSFEYMEKVVAYSIDHPSHSFTTIQHKFRKVREHRQLSRYR
jgi:hypothetical protein